MVFLQHKDTLKREEETSHESMPTNKMVETVNLVLPISLLDLSAGAILAMKKLLESMINHEKLYQSPRGSIEQVSEGEIIQREDH